MKRVLFVVLMALSLAVFAEESAPAPTLKAPAIHNGTLAFEYEHEDVGHTSNDTNSIAFIPGYKFENGIKLDVKLKGAQSENNNTTAVGIEPRIKYMWDITDTIALGGRASLGQVLRDSGDYTFYTVEPIVEWQFADRWIANMSYKYKDATGDLNDADSSTVYLGAGYKVFNDQTISAKVYDRNADAPNSDSKGIEVNYAINF